MTRALNPRQLTGQDDTHLITLPDGHRLQPEVASAFAALQADARQAGFELAIASSFRPFARQLAIWNGKASGARPVHDDQGGSIAMDQLSGVERLHAILRFSAIPGTSRHHWGTDLDVYDTAAVAPDYQLQLSLQEVEPGGVFDPLHCWLDDKMAAGESHGFYRPYAIDRGGVAAERWHLSYAPLALACGEQFSSELLGACWECEEGNAALLLRDEIEEGLQQIMARYVDVPGDWCLSPVLSR
jgi:LAS superfamily LD-carboxypeptidase LdcB